MSPAAKLVAETREVAKKCVGYGAGHVLDADHYYAIVERVVVALDAARAAGHDAGYRAGVEAAAKVANAYAKRADDQRHDENKTYSRQAALTDAGLEIEDLINALLAPVADAVAGTNKESK